MRWKIDALCWGGLLEHFCLRTGRFWQKECIPELCRILCTIESLWGFLLGCRFEAEIGSFLLSRSRLLPQSLHSPIALPFFQDEEEEEEEGPGLTPPGNCASLSKRLLTLHCLAHYRWWSREGAGRRAERERETELEGWEVLGNATWRPSPSVFQQKCKVHAV